MSNRIREMLKRRQEGELALAQENRPIDLNHAQENLQGMYEASSQQDALSPIPAGQDMLRSLYSKILGPSMAQQIIDQYLASAQRTLQEDINEGDDAQLMRPMISSVMQLDR